MKINKFIVMFCIAFIMIFASATKIPAADAESYYDTLDMDKLQQYGDFKTVFTQMLKGDMSGVKESLDPSKLLFARIKDCIDIMKGLLLICILNGIIALINFKNNKSVEYAAFTVSYLLTAGMCLKLIGQVMIELAGFADTFTGLFTAAMPVMAAILVISGRAALGSAAPAFIYAACSLTARAVRLAVLPCISFYAVCCIVNCLSPRGMLTRLSKLIHSCAVFGMRGFTMVFCLVLTFERAATSGADGVVQKAMVTAVKAVPVVGDVFAAGAESVMSVISNVKGSFGAAFIVITLAACMLPVIKIFVITAALKVTAALSEPLGDKKISDMIDASASASSLAFTAALCLMLMLMGAAAILMFGFGAS